MNKTAAKLCPFCNHDINRILGEDVYQNGLSVSLGHIFIIPRCHFVSLFDSTET